MIYNLYNCIRVYVHRSYYTAIFKQYNFFHFCKTLRIYATKNILSHTFQLLTNNNSNQSNLTGLFSFNRLYAMPSDSVFHSLLPVCISLQIQYSNYRLHKLIKETSKGFINFSRNLKISLGIELFV